MTDTASEPVHGANSAQITSTALVPEPISAAAFAPFGKLVTPMQDGAPDPEVDQALDLSGGRPRFYIMALAHRDLTITRITRHTQATQVLASVGGGEWLLAVAPPDAGPTPDPDAIRAFRIPGTVAVLLSRGTWHAGPYFEPAQMSFFNLELDDTNTVDHDTCDLAATFGRAFALQTGA